MKRASRIGVASRQFDFKKDQQPLHLSVTVSALEMSTNPGFVFVIEDTGDLLRAQKTAAWREVAQRIAHEMKNPLTPITLCAQRIARQIERAGSGEEPPSTDMASILRECADTISQEVESVRTLVDEFSQFARFPAAQPVSADLNEVVESALAVFAGRLDGIKLEKNLGEKLPAVYIDREQFKRVVVNLVDNSAEAMQESLSKHLIVCTRAAGADSVELEVADSGRGISVEDKERLFLPYFSTKGRGTGLGLAIVNHILSEHGAQIRVEDQLSGGSQVHCGYSHLGRQSFRPKAGWEQRMKRPRILVVDDEPLIRQSLRGVLGRTKATRLGKLSAARIAWRNLPAANHDLVLLDIWLPGMDGLEVLERIQENALSWTGPSVVMISGPRKY